MLEPQTILVPMDNIYWRETRFIDPEALARLVSSIKAHGIKQPIGVVVDGTRFRGIWGHRRFLAGKQLEFNKILAVVHAQPLTEDDENQLRLLENVARESLRPIEQAIALESLLKSSGSTATELAARVGLSDASISKSLALLKLPEPIRQRIDRGEISATDGYHLARIEDPADQAKLGEQIATAQISGGSLVRRLKAQKRPAEAQRKSGTSRVTAKLGGGRSIVVRAGNLNIETMISTLEELLARCRAARTKGLALATLLRVLADEGKRST
jgi:ParB family chromosome partitioning protein